MLDLFRRLYPQGRAFFVSKTSIIGRFHEAIGIVMQKAFDDAQSVLNSILPDNDLFTTEDATIWEKRLGLMSNENISLENRKKAIIRKIAHPGNIKGRQSAYFLQKQLNQAGFNLYVHENPNRLSPDDILQGSSLTEHRTSLEHGQKEHGDSYNNLVANSVYESEDSLYFVGSDYSNVFFVGAKILGGFSDVDQQRVIELRQLILRTKPVGSIAYLFINKV